MKDEDLRQIVKLMSAFRRGAREYGLGVYLMLAEISLRGEMSSRALDRVMGAAGYKNARQYRHEAQAANPRLLTYREDGDGKWWRLTPDGQAALARMVRRLPASFTEPVKHGRRKRRKPAGEQGRMLPGLFDEGDERN